MKLITYPDAEMMALDLANLLAGELETALQHQDRATLMVPGGQSPGPVFDSLCAADLDWERVDVMLSDERWLPEVHLRSNTRLVKQRLLADRAAAAVFHPLYAPAEAPEDVLPELESGLLPCLPVSVLLLGMGPDMHTASLFPEGDNLAAGLAPDAPVLVAMRAPDAPEPRVTITAPVLNAALSKHMILTGRAKRNALDKAQTLPPEKAPVAAVLSNCTVHWAP